MELEIGHVTHYYKNIGVAVLRLRDSLKLGDMIHILSHVTDFTQRVSSMEVDHHTVVRVKPGEEVAIKVLEPVRVSDLVFRVIKEAPEPAR